MMKKLVILGGGFAGVWAALGAVREGRRRGAPGADLAVTLVSRDPWLTIRPRLYEASLDGVRVPLDEVLGPAGIERVQGEVTRVDAPARTVAVEAADGPRVLRYDRLVLAAGSRVERAAIPGAEHAFTVDTYADAAALERHLAALPGRAPTPGGDARFTAVVVGAGLTGLEVATELVGRLRAVATGAGVAEGARVVLVGSASTVAPDLGPGPRRHVEEALSALRIEARVGRTVTAIEPGGVRLRGGEWIPAATTVWAGGLRASGLAGQLPVERDAAGRVPVDELLRVRGVDGVYAAGDVARAMADATHVAPMSCQHAIPMGERAGANAALDLLGLPGAPYAQPHHVTCLDLGEAGALFMEGWEPEVRLSGFWAKLVKETINTRLIYPPRAPHEPAVELAPGARSAA